MPNSMTNPSAVAEGRKLCEELIAEADQNVIDCDEQVGESEFLALVAEDRAYFAQNAAALRAFISHADAIEQKLAAVREVLEWMAARSNEAVDAAARGVCSTLAVDMSGKARAVLALFNRSPETK